ncbi:MAG: hypothetical protein JW963_18390 [Anaerolineales bacterium]|nr:hypothetical protein [Anaerolineales bacterium]
MLTVRKVLSIAVLLVLAACSALPETAPTAPVQVEKSESASTLLPAKPGTLADSVPAAVWKSNSEGHPLVPIDSSTGQVLHDYEPIALGQALFHAFSPDQRTLAAVGFVSSEHPRGGSLHLVDLSS